MERNSGETYQRINKCADYDETVGAVTILRQTHAKEITNLPIHILVLLMNSFPPIIIKSR